MSHDEELEELKHKKMQELYRRLKTLPAGQPTQASYPSTPIEVTDGSFDAVISRYPLVVVDFWAEWCYPCRAIAPIVAALAKDYTGKVVFAKLNVDENPQTAARFGIMSIPTLLIFRRGKAVDAIIGAVPRKVIEAKIKTYLAS